MLHVAKFLAQLGPADGYDQSVLETLIGISKRGAHLRQQLVPNIINSMGDSNTRLLLRLRFSLPLLLQPGGGGERSSHPSGNCFLVHRRTVKTLLQTKQELGQSWERWVHWEGLDESEVTGVERWERLELGNGQTIKSRAWEGVGRLSKTRELEAKRLAKSQTPGKDQKMRSARFAIVSPTRCQRQSMTQPQLLLTRP